jgi:hypothetical protein
VFGSGFARGLLGIFIDRAAVNARGAFDGRRISASRTGSQLRLVVMGFKVIDGSVCLDLDRVVNRMSRAGYRSMKVLNSSMALSSQLE